MSCINREALLAEYDREHKGPPGRARELIVNAPAADVREVKRGKWFTKEYMYGDPDVGTEDEWVDRLAEASDYYAYCSECGKDAGYNGDGTLILSEFCPNCGASMEEQT